MFSYPSASNLHVGHWYNYGPTDSFARFKKMKGYELFQPMGFDAFGLPAENFAIKTGIHPKDSTDKNIEIMETQLKAFSDLSVLGCFIGMLTDSRSLLSYPRHKYFRRILCRGRFGVSVPGKHGRHHSRGLPGIRRYAPPQRRSWQSCREGSRYPRPKKGHIS